MQCLHCSIRYENGTRYHKPGCYGERLEREAFDREMASLARLNFTSELADYNASDLPDC